ncbi:MAG: DinB family protein [Ignavibacteria bacterium]|nr:DinB family protein [Ignavibacteria bacterium]
MSNHKQFRDGPVGALMDEYERAALDLKSILSSLSQERFGIVYDETTSDPDCRSITTVMNHVVRAGYGYSNYIRTSFGNELEDQKSEYDVSTPIKACMEVDQMLRYMIDTLNDKWGLGSEDLEKRTFITRWGQPYNVEQILEHAIVHVLRHRRQIERWLQ